jgi:KamA family protein
MRRLELKHSKWHGNIATISQLSKFLKLSPKEIRDIRQVTSVHPMLVTNYYLSLINVRDKHDPIRKMIIPSGEELDLEGTYDPSREDLNTKMPGLQHKYRQTALILSTNRCAAYCRFCFRKRLVGLPSSEIISRFNQAVDYIKKYKEISNVLISGGDPFILPTKILSKFLEKLSPIKHLDFIRFGTRTPVTFPRRILRDPSLLNLLKRYSKKNRRIYVVTHFNHPREITKYSIDAIDKLIKAGVIVNNQTVLLKGVNDDPEVLADLLNNLVRIGVNPYYVFQCRPVKRVKHHFQVSLYRGYTIVEQTKNMLSGHSKRFKYVMSHRTGKIEIIGIKAGRMYFKYNQAKDSKNMGKFFSRKLNKTAGWLDELQ